MASLQSRARLTDDGNGTWVSYTYDDAGRLTQLVNLKSDNTTLSSFAYGLDNTGKRTGQTEANGDVVTYSYDNAYHLTGEQRSGANSYDITYAYDPVGNRLTKVEGGEKRPARRGFRCGAKRVVGIHGLSPLLTGRAVLRPRGCARAPAPRSAVGAHGHAPLPLAFTPVIGYWPGSTSRRMVTPVCRLRTWTPTSRSCAQLVGASTAPVCAASVCVGNCVESTLPASKLCIWSS